MNAEVIDKALSGVVKLRTVAAPAARSNATSVLEREGNGVLLSPRLVLTIGYLIMEADEVEITDHKGRKLPGKVAAFDQQTGFRIGASAGARAGQPLLLGDASALKRKRPGARRWRSGQCCASVCDVRREFTGGWEYLLDSAIFTFPPIADWGGAALIDPSGKLVGVGSLFVRDADGNGKKTGQYHFVPVDILKPILDELIETGQRKETSARGSASPHLRTRTE